MTLREAIHINRRLNSLSLSWGDDQWGESIGDLSLRDMLAATAMIRHYNEIRALIEEQYGLSRECANADVALTCSDAEVAAIYLEAKKKGGGHA